MKKILLILPIIILIAAGCANNTVDTTVTPDSGTMASQKPNTAPQNHNSLTITDQTVDDIKVNLGLQATNVYLEKDGFVIISDIKNDSPNKVIPNNFGLISAGRELAIVMLSAPTTPGVYMALLYEDNGDKVFNKNTDKVLPLYSTECSCYDAKAVRQFNVK